jgi:hypothetical protein
VIVFECGTVAEVKEYVRSRFSAREGGASRVDFSTSDRAAPV